MNQFPIELARSHSDREKQYFLFYSLLNPHLNFPFLIFPNVYSSAIYTDIAILNCLNPRR